MNINKTSYLIAVGILVLSMLACNLGSNPVPSLPQEGAPTDNPSSSSGACVNPYLPVIAGATWNYKLAGPVSDTFTRSIISVETSGFTDQDVYGAGLTRQGKWK